MRLVRRKITARDPDEEILKVCIALDQLYKWVFRFIHLLGISFV